jgi:hypothetical protein
MSPNKSTDNQGRRMGDKDVPLDAARQAVRMSELEGLLALQQQALKTAVDNMSSTLTSVQADVRRTGDAIHDLALQQATNERDREAVARLEVKVSEINTRLEDWFSDRERQEAARWSAYERERDEYRLRKEADIENEFRDVLKSVGTIDGRVGKIENRMSLWTGIALAFTLLASTVVGGFMWVLNGRFETQAAQIRELYERGDANRGRIEVVKDKQHEMELHLARTAGYRPDTNDEEPK